jgi:hypothetical protein
MSITITNPASPGRPTPVTAEQPVRAPLAGFIPWTTPTLEIPLGFDAQVRPINASVVDLLGGKNHGNRTNDGRDI